jgi:hypothetical protein
MTVEGKRKEMERISPRSPRSPPLICAKCYRTRARSWDFERGQREREGWSARVPFLVGFARGEGRKRKE